MHVCTYDKGSTTNNVLWLQIMFYEERKKERTIILWISTFILSTWLCHHTGYFLDTSVAFLHWNSNRYSLSFELLYLLIMYQPQCHCTPVHTMLPTSVCVVILNTHVNSVRMGNKVTKGKSVLSNNSSASFTYGLVCTGHISHIKL